MVNGFDGNGQAGFFVVFALVNFIAIIRAWGYPSADALDGWMTRHGLRTESPSRALIAVYLRRTRWIRTIGFLVGWNVPYVLMWAPSSARQISEVGEFWWAPGFALGIVVAELVRPRSGGGRSATLEPRKLSHYLPSLTRIDGWIIAGIVVSLAVLGVGLRSEGVRPIEPAEIRGSVAWYSVLCALAIGIVVGTRFMQEAIVRRRQSFDSVDETRADDALRSASIQGLAGVGYGGAMWIGAIMAWDLTLSTEDPLSGLFDVVTIVLALAGFFMLVALPRFGSHWIVRRARES